MSTYLSIRLVPTDRLKRDGYRERLIARAMTDAERRGIDLIGKPSLHVENGASGAPPGTRLVVVHGPAREREDPI